MAGHLLRFLIALIIGMIFGVMVNKKDGSVRSSGSAFTG
jgi:hypothetical protein